ncbi:MAG: hypothetical protein ACI95R_002869, partial [Halioglobus sp.]
MQRWPDASGHRNAGWRARHHASIAWQLKKPRPVGRGFLVFIGVGVSACLFDGAFCDDVAQVGAVFA